MQKQVIVGPEDDDGPWYFSLNNRRLWVFKRCRDEGLLDNNLIRVRVRQPKSGSEEERYTLENCAVEAKFIREKDPKRNERKNSSADAHRLATGEQQTDVASKCGNGSSTSGLTTENKAADQGSDTGGIKEESDEDSGSESSDAGATVNRFSALM